MITCHDHQIFIQVEEEGCPICNAEATIRCLEREIREAINILVTRKITNVKGGDTALIGAANRVVRELKK